MLRNRSIAITVFLTVVLGTFCFAEDLYVPGELLIKFKGDIVVLDDSGKKIPSDKALFNSSRISQLNKKHGLMSIKKVTPVTKKSKKLRDGRQVDFPDLSNIMLMEFPKDADVKQIMDDYKTDPSVELVSLNYIRKLFVTPNDTFYLEDPAINGNQWGLFKIWLKPTGDNVSGWDFCTGSSEIKVAVIDTGANFTHTDLKDRLNTLEGWDFVNDDPYAIDDNGHGTHVSGIIGAQTNNAYGVAGVDWNCRIIPIKAFSSGGGGTDDDIINALIWAVSFEADVINMSFGDSSNDPFLEGAIAYAATSDAVLVAAAGNANTQTLQYPAAYDKVLSVAATDSDDYKASYSSYGTWVDVSAPGGDEGSTPTYFTYYILSTYIPNNTFTWSSGTSMAAPFVSGLAALLRAKHPTFTAEAIADRIIRAVDKIDNANPGYEGKLGSGRINAFLALGGLYGKFNLPPDYPANNDEAVPTIYGITNINGTATGLDFDHYSLEQGIGKSPTSWTTVGAVSYTSKVNDTLGVFDATGMDSWVTFRLILNDEVSRETRMTVKAGSIASPLLEHKVQYGPNPFNPNKGSILIKYKLDANSDVYIYFYDITGNLIARKYFGYGSSGGASGDNAVYWDGKNDFGETVANGVYLFRIASEGRTIGKGKIVVIK